MLVEKQTGVKPAQLRDLVELPESCEHVWIWFLRMHNTRQSSAFGGVNYISYSEMMGFFYIEGITPHPWEIRLINRLDSIAVEHINKEQEKLQKRAAQRKSKPSK